MEIKAQLVTELREDSNRKNVPSVESFLWNQQGQNVHPVVVD